MNKMELLPPEPGPGPGPAPEPRNQNAKCSSCGNTFFADVQGKFKFVIRTLVLTFVSKKICPMSFRN